MSDREQCILERVAAVTAVLFVASIVAAIAGIYIAIWGDNGLGGRIIATGFVTAALIASVGLPAYRAIRDAP